MSASRRTILLGGLAQAAWAAQETSLRAGRVQAKLLASGGIGELRYEKTPLHTAALGDGCLELTVGGKTVRCDRPVRFRRIKDGAAFDYRADPLDVTYEVTLRELPDGAAVLTQRVSWKSDRRYSDPVGLFLPRTLRIPEDRRSLFIPTREGVARRDAIPAAGAAWVYGMAGGDPASSKLRLAVPLVSEYAAADGLRLTLSSEPEFTTSFLAAGASSPGHFAWAHTAGGEAGQVTARTFHTVIHRGTDRQAFYRLYETALAPVKPGPAWLHGVTLIDYDYMSKGGRGWFADIDALAKLIPLRERGRVALTIHGWYDYVGRYCFNPKAKALDRTWLAFPNVSSPQFQAHARGPRSKTAEHWGWRRILDGLKPIEMTIDDLRRRMRYARERGFRCILYFGDGVNSGDGLQDVHEPGKVLTWGGWVGPETSGKTYAQNPLHPGVRSFYRDYLQALLHEFGRDLDGFVWDETFHVRMGQKGTEAAPGYADAAMMSLVSELRAITERHSPELAFLTSDIVGTGYQTPYALVSHGTYQDSMSSLRYWPYGLFPNLRNSLWSCNWYHQMTWERNEKTVATYELPVAVSNGFGDDTGPADMNAEQAGRMMALYRQLGDRKLALEWIEETGAGKTYKGRPVPAA